MEWTFHDFPDAEAVVVSYLVACGVKHVSTELPSSPVWPCVTVSRVGGTATAGMGADQPNIQIDVWGSTKADSHDLMAHILTLMWEMPASPNVSGATVTDVMPTTGMLWLPDQTVVPTRPRYVAGVQITLY